MFSGHFNQVGGENWMVVWTGYMWLRTGTSSGPLWTR